MIFQNSLTIQNKKLTLLATMSLLSLGLAIQPAEAMEWKGDPLNNNNNASRGTGNNGRLSETWDASKVDLEEIERQKAIEATFEEDKAKKAAATSNSQQLLPNDNNAKAVPPVEQASKENPVKDPVKELLEERRLKIEENERRTRQAEADAAFAKDLAEKEKDKRDRQAQEDAKLAAKLAKEFEEKPAPLVHPGDEEIARKLHLSFSGNHPEDESLAAALLAEEEDPASVALAHELLEQEKRKSPKDDDESLAVALQLQEEEKLVRRTQRANEPDRLPLRENRAAVRHEDEAELRRVLAQSLADLNK